MLLAWLLILELPVATGSTPFARIVDHYERLGYLSGAVLVAQHGKVLYESGIGYADRDGGIPNTPRTKFGIASLTKQFTAALVLQQAQQGSIRLDAPLSDYLPWYRRDTGTRITIEQLLHHTSGLPSDFDDPEDSDSEATSRHDVPAAFAQHSCQRNLTAAPGERWQYSNCGYLLLGLVLESVTHRPYEELLRHDILSPLGMADSGLDHNDLVRHGGAIGYQRLAGWRYKHGPYIDQGHVFSAGSMYSSVEDLFRWSQALNGSAVIPATARDAIFTPAQANWGYGWFITKLPDGTTLEEMRGDMPGNYFATIRRYPERDAVIIVLRNGYGSTKLLEENLEAALLGNPVRLPRADPKDLVANLWFREGKSALIILTLVVAAFAARRALSRHPARSSAA